MKYLNYKEVETPGYYWWLPKYLEDKPELEENWSIISWHPASDGPPKRGLYYGPLKGPVFKKEK